MIPLLEDYGLPRVWLGYIIVFGVLELRGNFTLRFVAASLKACGKLNVKAGDLILYTDIHYVCFVCCIKKTVM